MPAASKDSGEECRPSRDGLDGDVDTSRLSWSQAQLPARLDALDGHVGRLRRGVDIDDRGPANSVHTLIAEPDLVTVADRGPGDAAPWLGHDVSNFEHVREVRTERERDVGFGNCV